HAVRPRPRRSGLVAAHAGVGVARRARDRAAAGCPPARLRRAHESPRDTGWQLDVALRRPRAHEEHRPASALPDGEHEPNLNRMPGEGFEPPRPRAAGFKPAASTGFATPAGLALTRGLRG